MEEISRENLQNLCSSLGIGEIFAKLLVQRGITSAEEGRRFLYPSAEDFEDPFLLNGMEDAVKRIRTAIEEKEKIVVYGDYDCDGVTATAILYDYLRSLGADVSYFIPNRFGTGYGLSTETLEEIAETLFPDLIITVDCGISSVEEALFMEEVLAIDLIVTDHHNLPSELPHAIVVNPKLNPECRSTNLCGAGVAFKLVQALGGIKKAWKYVELAAIATVADVVPLTGENRLIASLGLKKINSREKINKGLRLLIESIGLSEVGATEVGFGIAPRINAVGRLGDCSEVVNLFTTEEYLVLQGLIEKLNRANELRKSLTQEVYREARDLLKEYDLATHKIILLYKEGWNPGVLGLVAGYLTNDFGRPVVLVTGDEELKGSARSPEGVDIYAVLKSAEEFLVKFGGHKGAAGLTVLRENLIAARNKMDDYLEQNCPKEVFSRQEYYDLSLFAEEITLPLAKEIALLEPTGEGNKKPIFRFSTADYEVRAFGNGAHVKGKINDKAEILGFGMPYLAEAGQTGVRYDLLCESSINVYKNVEKVQMKVVGAFSKGLAEGGESLSLFNRYLRSNLYCEEACESVAVEWSELPDLLYDEDFCTLYLSLSRESAIAAQSLDGLKGKIASVEYGKGFDAPHNEVLIAPDADPVGYKRIVLLDTPLTKGYVARLAKNSGAEIYVAKDRYPYQGIFKNADLSVESIRATYERIGRFLYAGSGASSPLDLAERLSPTDPYLFLLHFYILFETGAISVGQGFAFSVRGFVDPAESLFFRRLSALKKKL